MSGMRRKAGANTGSALTVDNSHDVRLPRNVSRVIIMRILDLGWGRCKGVDICWGKLGYIAAGPIGSK